MTKEDKLIAEFQSIIKDMAEMLHLIPEIMNSIDEEDFESDEAMLMELVKRVKEIMNKDRDN